jgi:hypothetical protein
MAADPLSAGDLDRRGTIMTTPLKTVYGASQDVWDSAYHRSVQEFGAQRYVIYKEGQLIRIALGNNGPPTDELGGRGTPVFSHAVTLSTEVAVQLARSLRDLVAEPLSEQQPPS